MPTTLHNRTVLVIGRGSGIARAVALAARDAGAKVVMPLHVSCELTPMGVTLREAAAPLLA